MIMIICGEGAGCPPPAAWRRLPGGGHAIICYINHYNYNSSIIINHGGGAVPHPPRP